MSRTNVGHDLVEIYKQLRAAYGVIDCFIEGVEIIRELRNTVSQKQTVEGNSIYLQGKVDALRQVLDVLEAVDYE